MLDIEIPFLTRLLSLNQSLNSNNTIEKIERQTTTVPHEKMNEKWLWHHTTSKHGMKSHTVQGGIVKLYSCNKSANSMVLDTCNLSYVVLSMMSMSIVYIRHHMTSKHAL